MIAKLARAFMRLLQRVPALVPGRRRYRGGPHTLEATLTADTAPMRDAIEEIISEGDVITISAEGHLTISRGGDT